MTLFVVLDVPNAGSTLTALLLGTTVGTKMFSSAAVLIFSVLCLILAGQINNIHRQLVKLAHSQSISPRSASNQCLILKSIRKQYGSVSSSVELLNKCFGFILMFEIPCIFIGVINTSMFLVISVNVDDAKVKTFSVVFLINHVVNLTSICLTSEKLQVQVSFSVPYETQAEILGSKESN